MSDEKLRGALKSRLRELGISAREASRRAGFNVGYVGDILDGRSKTPDAGRILKLAESLDMDATDLLADSPDSRATPARERGEAMPFGEERRGGGRMVPLYGAPLPINRQFVPFAAEPVGKVPCMFMLLDVPDAFAAMVPNNASAPRFCAGETIFVNPSATPAPSDFVWVRRTDETVAIARLDSIDAESFKLEFIGLEGDQKFAEVPIEEVRAIKRIAAIIL